MATNLQEVVGLSGVNYFSGFVSMVAFLLWVTLQALIEVVVDREGAHRSNYYFKRQNQKLLQLSIKLSFNIKIFLQSIE